MRNNPNTNTGISLSGMIFLLLLTFKLAEIGVVKDWSWWAVTSPIWFPVFLLVSILILEAIVVYIRMKIRQKRFRQRHGIVDIPRKVKNLKEK